MTLPLVSIFCFCKDRAYSIGRAIDSLLAQTYPNVEIIVQDGASTDGTLEILQKYGDKIKLISTPDSGPEEGFRVAFRRCTGKYIGSCQSDEELLPRAVAQSVDYLEKHPDVGVIHGDMLLADLDGNVIREALSDHFEIQKFLHGWYPPNFSSAFFRSSALESIGLWKREFRGECCEYEIWSRLGLDYPVIYIPGSISKYGTHGKQLSKVPEKLFQAFRARVEVIGELYREHPKLPKDPESAKQCIKSNALFYSGLFRELCGESSPYGKRIEAYVKKFCDS